EHTKRSWSSTIYAFFTNDVEIEYRSGQLHHVFTCTARGCGHHVTRNQTTLDQNSTKNLKKHAKKCCRKWSGLFGQGPRALVNSQGCEERSTHRYFQTQHSRWHPRLCLPVRPTMWIPSPTTIARDVKLLFGKTRERLRDRFHDRDRCVSLATDAWTSPNHRAFVAVTGHWEENGQKVDCLLDFIEVP
ncbi:hypothetical protein DFH07DRAFT_704046, partial [Mycena maculata]